MQIKRHTKRINKPILIIAIILLIGVVVFLSYALASKSKNNSPVPIDATGSKNSSSETQQSKNPVDSPEDKAKAPNADTPTTPKTTPESSKKQVQMVASVSRLNGTVFIRGGVNYPVTSGNCFAELSGPSGQSMRIESTLLPNPISTDCKTISIPEGNLAPGRWTFTLNYTSEEYEGASSEVLFTL